MYKEDIQVFPMAFLSTYMRALVGGIGRHGGVVWGSFRPKPGGAPRENVVLILIGPQFNIR